MQACERIFRHTKAKVRRLAGGKSRDFNAGMAEKMPQDGQRPDAQSGATPRNDGRMGGRNHLPGMAPRM